MSVGEERAEVAGARARRPSGSDARLWERGRAAVFEDALAVLAVLATLFSLWRYASTSDLAVDYKQEYLVAALRLIHGLDPYSRGWQHIAGGIAFPYPAATALAFVPFALIPRGASGLIWVALCIASLFGTLRVLDVRDWRVYAISLLWFPVINAWQSGNLTLPLCLAIALTWRYRDRPVIAGLSTAVAISLKPLVWPLALWLIATRRYAAALAAILWGVIINAVAWQVVGLRQLDAYVRLSSDVTKVLERSGYGVIAISSHVGLGVSPGVVVEVLLSVILAGGCLIAGRAGRDSVSLTLCVGLMLAASPLVWNHYFALLVVPLAITRPRLAPIWVVPLLLWLCPAEHVQAWQAVLAAAVTCGVLYRLVADPGAAACRGASEAVLV